LAEWLKAGTC